MCFQLFKEKTEHNTPYTIKVHEYTTYLVYSLVGKVSKQIKIVTGQILLYHFWETLSKQSILYNSIHKKEFHSGIIRIEESESNKKNPRNL